MNNIKKTMIINRTNILIEKIYIQNNIKYKTNIREFRGFGGSIQYLLIIPENADDHTYESYKTHANILKTLISKILDGDMIDKHFLNSCERIYRIYSRYSRYE